LELGEDYLCEICREHPRFYHDTPYGKEVGIGMSCEEACRLILSSDDYAAFEEIEELDWDDEEWMFDGTVYRSRIYEILADQTRPYAQRLQSISHTYGVTPDVLSDEKWRELFASLEYLNEEHRELFATYTSVFTPAEKWEMILERALAYFVFRHCSGAWDMEEFRAGLGFALVCERLLASMVCAQEGITLDGVLELARILSEELEYSEENTEAIKSCFE
jgi:lysine-N-methylase